MAAKRKAREQASQTSAKRRNIDDSNIKNSFRDDLFEPQTLQSFQKSYASSGPYPHAVVGSLIQENLLRNVREEITSHISFTLKETDIYRIHQSGDLANLSRLDPESLAHLPSLVKLRDALYSSDFREWVSDVTGAGKLSGAKTDMAVNVYTPGSYLLCHDDVIGSRRVSYILYLTDPDNPWKPEWGGGLRLYPTEARKNTNGDEVKVPLADWSLNIPPSFSQLSFFAVRPGESYHDVEEVYHGKDSKADRGRIRMAVSGWFHIPQEGEDGFEDGVEQAQAQKSSLAQLKGAANEFDEPPIIFEHFDEPRTVMNSSATTTEQDPGDNDDQDEDILTEQDLTFLLQYISASFLTPDMIEQTSQTFSNESMLQLDRFLCEKFATELKDHITNIEGSADGIEDQAAKWKVARPPHKHRYSYLQEGLVASRDNSPVSRLLVDLLHSHAFKKWLALTTGLKTSSLLRQQAIARRFRRGKDYALANAYQGEQPQIEFTISITPSTGWEAEPEPKHENGNHTTNGHSSKSADGVQVSTGGQIEFGGEEVYMAGDDDDESIHSKSLTHIGKKADPAIYKSAQDGDSDDDDGILFTNTPVWNQFSVVLRDQGTLRFVKYVSQAANGDRWDVKGEVELAEDAFDDNEGDEGSDRPDDENDLSGQEEDDDEEVEDDEAEDSDEA